MISPAAALVLTASFGFILYAIITVMIKHSNSPLERVTLAMLAVVVLGLYCAAIGIIPVEHV